MVKHVCVYHMQGNRSQSRVDFEEHGDGGHTPAHLADESCQHATELQLGGGQALGAELLLEVSHLDVLLEGCPHCPLA